MLTARTEHDTPPGLLIHKAGWGLPLGYGGPSEHVTCITCDTSYPVMDGENGRSARCNGYEIDRCPWCRSDSAPWTNGRGI